MLSLKTLFRAVALVLVLVTLAGAWDNAKGLAVVTVTLKEGAEETSDVAIGASALPDYAVRVEVDGSWESLGSRADTSAAEGLSFEVVDRIPIRRITQIELSENDAVNDDLLERHDVESPVIVGESYTFELAERFDAQIGISWLVGTPVGMLLMFGVLIFVLLAGIRAGISDLS